MPWLLLVLLSSAVWSSESILSDKNLASWQKDCRKCSMEFQYDIIHGKVLRLESTPQTGAVVDQALGNSFNQSTSISWLWSLDTFVAHAQIFSVTLTLESPVTKQPYLLHYVWDASAEQDSQLALSEHEFVWVVNGAESKPFRWYHLERNFVEDFQALSQSDLNVSATQIKFGLGSIDNRTMSLSGYIAQIGLSH